MPILARFLVLCKFFRVGMRQASNDRQHAEPVAEPPARPTKMYEDLEIELEHPVVVQNTEGDGNQDEAADNLGGWTQPGSALDQPAQVETDAGEQGGDQADDQSRQPDAYLEQRKAQPHRQ